MLKPKGVAQTHMSTLDKTDKTDTGSSANIEPELLTKAEAAHLLGISTRTVDNLMRQRRISFVKLTRKMVRFPRREIMDHIREHLTIRAHGLEGR